MKQIEKCTLLKNMQMHEVLIPINNLHVYNFKLQILWI